MQQSDDRKFSIYKSITDTRKKKRKIIAVGITTENQYVFATTITGFMNKQQVYNEVLGSSVNPHMNGSNAGENRKKLQPQKTSQHI